MSAPTPGCAGRLVVRGTSGGARRGVMPALLRVVMPPPSCVALLGAALLGWLVVAPSAVSGQDVEVRGEIHGVTPPPSYYRAVEENPELFTLPNGLFGSGAQGPRPGEPAAAPARAPATGTATVPVILALFSDSEDPGATFSREEIARVLFDGPAPRGTITEAFDEMSRGAFTVTGDVFPWVRTSRPMEEIVGTENGFGEDADLGSYFVEALDLTDPDIDFGQYDNDGPDGIPNSGDDDGVVDALVFEYLEIAGSCGGPSIWPHRSGMRWRTGTGEPYRTADASAHPEKDVIEVDGYITQGVTDCTGEGLQTANVITHEYGHVLGLPDFYHWVDRSAGPRGRRWVLGCWGLMAAGSWGCGEVEEEGELRDPFGPTHLSAWSKWELGWVDLMDPGEVWNEEIVLEPIQSSGVGLALPLDAVGDEFLLVEYRAQSGFDAELPAEGVLFYKIDHSASLRPDPASADPYRNMLLERDGDRGLLRTAINGGDRGVAGDAWGAGGMTDKLNYHSTPRLVMSDGSYSPAVIHEVHLENGQARIVLSTGQVPRLVTPTEAFEVMKIRTFSVPVRIAGGRGPYTGVGALPDGFSLEALGDELLLVGSVTEEGPHVFSYAVQDASGDESDPVTVEVSAPIEWVVEEAALLDPFLDVASTALTPGEQVHLDDVGNGNGRYDVGDLRSWLRENR